MMEIKMAGTVMMEAVMVREIKDTQAVVAAVDKQPGEITIIAASFLFLYQSYTLLLSPK
jgi:hypothetical protein